MNVGSFSKQQNQTIDTDCYNRFLFTTCVSEFILNTMKRFFEQRCDFHFTKGLIVHIVSSSYKVSSFELWKEKKATQKLDFCVANDIGLNEIHEYDERVYADKVLSKLWFVRSFSSRHHSQFLANIASEILSQVRTEKCKTRSIICTVNCSFLRPSRQFNCDTAFAVIVCFLNEGVLGFMNIHNGRVKNRFQIVKFRWMWMFF